MACVLHPDHGACPELAHHVYVVPLSALLLLFFLALLCSCHSSGVAHLSLPAVALDSFSPLRSFCIMRTAQDDADDSCMHTTHVSICTVTGGNQTHEDSCNLFVILVHGFWGPLVRARVLVYCARADMHI
jgi:hypothetical protein